MDRNAACFRMLPVAALLGAFDAVHVTCPVDHPGIRVSVGTQAPEL